MQCWISPQAILDSVSVITDDAILVVNPPREKRASIKERLGAGEDPYVALGRSALVIPFNAVTRIRWQEKSDHMYVFYKCDGARKSKRWDFDFVKDCNEAFDALAEKLATAAPTDHQARRVGFTSGTIRYSSFRAAIAPILWGLAAAGITLLLREAAEDLAAGTATPSNGRHVILRKILTIVLNMLGPTGVTVVGGATVMIIAVWLIFRVSDPPIVRELIR
jgi:hypothetical protein